MQLHRDRVRVIEDLRGMVLADVAAQRSELETQIQAAKHGLAKLAADFRGKVCNAPCVSGVTRHRSTI